MGRTEKIRKLRRRVRAAVAGVFLAAATPALRGESLLHEISFGEGLPDSWHPAGSCSASKTGAILVDFSQEATGTLSWGQRLYSGNVRVKATVLFEAGAAGFGEGFAMGILATPSVPVLGEGGAFFGLNNISQCLRAVLCEIDTQVNDVDDFGPIGSGAFHAGISCLTEGCSRGESFLPTLAAKDIEGLFGPERGEIDVVFSLTPDGTATLQCGPAGGALSFFLSTHLSDSFPFEGYLVLGASNSAIGSRVTVERLSVETDLLPPPAFTAHSEGTDVTLRWETEEENYAGFVLYRDGVKLAELPAKAREYLDAGLQAGPHTYFLEAVDPAGTEAPPARQVVYTGTVLLLVDAGTSSENAWSEAAQAWGDYLSAQERSFVRVTSVEGLNLADFRPVLWIGGGARAQRAFRLSEEQALAQYIAHRPGSRLLLEGADLWSMPQAGILSAKDGVGQAEDGWPAHVVADQWGDEIPYAGGGVSLDELAPAGEELGGDTAILWKRTDLEGERILGFALRGPSDRFIVINSSVELARISDVIAQQDYAWNVLSLLDTPPPAGLFLRGDASGDGDVNIADAIGILGFLFAGKNLPRCPDAADANDDGTLQISDAISLLGYLFAGGAMPPPSEEGCGVDPTPDSLPPCEESACL